jgi:hypothetical protein
MDSEKDDRIDILRTAISLARREHEVQEIAEAAGYQPTTLTGSHEVGGSIPPISTIQTLAAQALSISRQTPENPIVSRLSVVFGGPGRRQIYFGNPPKNFLTAGKSCDTMKA